MSLLTVMRMVTDELGLQRPTSGIVGTVDQQTLQMTALLVYSAAELLRARDWQFFIMPHTLTTVPGQQAYPMPTAFLRFVDETMWNTSNTVPLQGPLIARDWAQQTWGVALSGLYYRFTVRQGQLLLLPIPQSVSTLNFLYVTNTWVNAGGDPAAPSSVLHGDNDTFNFPEDLLASATKWRFLRAKKLDYAEEQATYLDLLHALMAQDTPGKMLSMDPDESYGGSFAGGIIVPVTGYGGVS